MAKQKQTAEVNKSEEIRQVLKVNPKAKAKEVVATLDEKGVKVTPAQVYFVMGRLKGRRKKAKKVAVASMTAATTPSVNGDALKTILSVKAFAAEVGGMKKLIELAQALSE